MSSSLSPEVERPFVNLRRSLLVATLLATVTVPLAATDGAAVSRERVVPDLRALDRVPAPVTGRFTGIDGRQHDNAPLAVTGRKGWLYFGADFDLACSYGGPRLAKAADQLARVANIIRQSGRRVVWTMAPNKTGPLARYVKANKYPHGNCDKRGLAEQTMVVRTYDAPDYLPMVDPLASSKHEVYWKTDPHWVARSTPKRLRRSSTRGWPRSSAAATAPRPGSARSTCCAASRPRRPWSGPTRPRR
jgi:hypothetical protein